MMRSNQSWVVGEWTFHRVTDHGFSGELEGVALFGFEVQGELGTFGKPKLGELYLSLEHAMAAAIAEKHTGKRGAGGTGVGTAADWFMKMIGVSIEP
jgi:hypothetical protein